MEKHRSYCPINLAIEIIGDKWTLLIIRDIMMDNKRHFREILSSDESIATNILTDRLNMLERRGVLTKQPDPSHKQKKIYSLTQMGIDLFPVIMSIAKWSSDYLPVDEVSSKHAKMILDGGPELEFKMKRALQEDHLKTKKG